MFRTQASYNSVVLRFGCFWTSGLNQPAFVCCTVEGQLKISSLSLLKTACIFLSSTSRHSLFIRSRERDTNSGRCNARASWNISIYRNTTFNKKNSKINIFITAKCDYKPHTCRERRIRAEGLLLQSMFDCVFCSDEVGLST